MGWIGPEGHNEPTPGLEIGISSMLSVLILIRIKGHCVCNLLSNNSESVIQRENDDANEAKR